MRLAHSTAASGDDPDQRQTPPAGSCHLPVQRRVGGSPDLAHPALADEGGDRVVAESGADVQRHELLGLDRGHSTYGASAAPAAAQECPENTNVHVEATSRDPANMYDRSIMEVPEPVC